MKIEINKSNEDQAFSEICNRICEIIDSNKTAVVSVSKKSTRTISMNKLWWMWMTETSAWMNRQGAKIEVKNKRGKVIHNRPVSAQDAHEMFVMHWLGLTPENERELTRDMQKGRMLFLMDKHSEWALEKGFSLTYPSDCEYSKLKQQTES